MMKSIGIGLALSCLICYSCSPKATDEASNLRLAKIEISDSCLKSILENYITEFPFDGKGIYIVNIRNYDDSIKYYVGMAFTEQDINQLLKYPPYFFYSIINGRTVIIDTKLENLIKPVCRESSSDSIMNNYFEYNRAWGIREVYYVEYTKKGSDLKRKVVYFNPF